MHSMRLRIAFELDPLRLPNFPNSLEPVLFFRLQAHLFSLLPFPSGACGHTQFEPKSSDDPTAAWQNARPMFLEARRWNGVCRSDNLLSKDTQYPSQAQSRPQQQCGNRGQHEAFGGPVFGSGRHLDLFVCPPLSLCDICARYENGLP